MHNRTRATLHGFRVLGPHRQWTVIGDLPPGDSGFEAVLARPGGLGTFEFQYEDQLASGDYTMGGFRASADGVVRIDLDAAPGSVDSAGMVDEGRGSMLLSAPPMADAAAQPPADQRIALVTVPRERAGKSMWMLCMTLAPIGSYVTCVSWHGVQYGGVGAGLALGFSVGYFWSPYSGAELSSQFPVHVTSTHLFVVHYLDFFTLATDRKPSLNLGQFVGAGPGLGTAYTAVGGLTLQGDERPAAGSYAASCTDIGFESDKGELSARCASAAGGIRESRLVVASCLGGDVANVDGTLRCARPPGSYQDSCAPIRMVAGVLQASCALPGSAQRVDSRLDYAHDCDDTSTVSNLNGALRCDSPRLPPGPYRSSCSRLHYEDGVLSADCGGALDTRALNLRLDYRRSCKPGSEVDFLPRYAGRGELRCRDPQ